MSSSETLLTFQTIPSTWTHRDRPRTPAPYLRVVGLESSAGLVACRFELAVPPASLTYSVTAEFAERVTAFFDEHIAGHDPEDPRSPEQSRRATAPEMRYNCHLFALSMLGIEYQDEADARHKLQELTRDYTTPVEGNLALGAHALLQHTAIGSLGRKLVTHGTIGMGEDVPLCLQVVNNNSNLGLMPYDLMRESFLMYPGPHELVTTG